MMSEHGESELQFLAILHSMSQYPQGRHSLHVILLLYHTVRFFFALACIMDDLGEFTI